MLVVSGGERYFGMEVQWGGGRVIFNPFLSMQRHRANARFRRSWGKPAPAAPPPPLSPPVLVVSNYTKVKHWIIPTILTAFLGRIYWNKSSCSCRFTSLFPIFQNQRNLHPINAINTQSRLRDLLDLCRGQKS